MDADLNHARSASGQEMGKLLHTLVQAFRDDPFQQWLWPDDASRPGCILRSFRVVLASNLARGSVWTTENAESVAVWVPPGKPPMTPGAVGSHLPSMLYLTARTGRRAPTVMSGMRQIQAHKPAQPHWHLILVGTAPPAQGRGLATAALAPALRRCDDEGVPAYLESSHERNVPYYQRLGFTVIGEFTLPQGPPIWSMWRD
jgi:GNAT superfamily N-acetyltransferase